MTTKSKRTKGSKKEELPEIEQVEEQVENAEIEDTDDEDMDEEDLDAKDDLIDGDADADDAAADEEEEKPVIKSDKHKLMANVPKQLRWQKLGRGNFRLTDGTIIKPNQIFMAFENDIPKVFRDVVKCLDDVALAEQEKATIQFSKESKPIYEIIKRHQGWYDLLNSEGKPINERALRIEEAEELKASLEV